ncbi:hypothetical protein ABW19_dt0201859 [Dactylella cylindrospora]|nr:hypothetical protein ABW19_dt0201859 [Dactylella cylindrospora]
MKYPLTDDGIYTLIIHSDYWRDKEQWWRPVGYELLDRGMVHPEIWDDKAQEYIEGFLERNPVMVERIPAVKMAMLAAKHGSRSKKAEGGV